MATFRAVITAVITATLFSLIALLLPAAAARGQTVAGSNKGTARVDTSGPTVGRHYAMLHGYVLVDPTDKPVPGAEVFVAPDHSARTNDAGEFRILGIPPGNHVVVVRHLGSAPITVSLDLAVGDTVIREF
ncbi:MAG: carboxypeptidase-like regulatory domain-containing protein, partial [Gemmatimonadaceae bacterium]